MNSRQILLNYFKDDTLTGKTFGEIFKFLELSHKDKKILSSLLDSLCEDGYIYRLKNGKYMTPEKAGLIKGTISGNERGFAFLVPIDRTLYPNDFFIPHKSLNGAMHGDTVYAERVYGRSDDEVRVVSVISRGYTKLVGTFYKDRRSGFLIPDEKKYYSDIYIPFSECFNIKNGVKAIAEITEYPRGKCPGGKIIEILDEGDDFLTEELSIIRSYDLNEKFPQNVENEAERQSNRTIYESDLINRTDLRDQTIITIDGEDTRDIDDAVSVEKLGENYVLGVHIADVTNYVKYRSILDKEALNRGTSVYFPDRVLPMLPKALSNGICSLDENEDRLALSCIMTINKNGVVKDSKIVKSVIRSKHRMTYTNIQAMLDGDDNIISQYEDIKDMVTLFSELTHILKKMREKKGCIELDIKEAKIMVDKDGNIIIPDFHPCFAREIIEQFMVITNETVAEYMHSIDMPFVYRIHEKPSEEKAAMFCKFAQNLGLKANFSTNEVKPYDYQKLLYSAEDKDIYPILNRTMLRSMQKAKYSPENLGHFGLASTCYCHFTSPIRRYPDLCIHRIIKEVLDGKYSEAREKYENFVYEASDKSSEKERLAAEAEREVDALYAVMYMSDKIGEEYDAVISGVASFGLFAELPNTLEGFIPIETLAGQFEFIPERYLLKGNKESYTIGEKIRIKVISVDFADRRIKFDLIEKIDNIEQGDFE